ncbi:MAG: Coq4 family protein [Pseudomonadales bacterium]|jgi:ubiquinone biosynthesis protein Coq4|nr:Coq4 family protein [Pseudomonadales bacterium]
MTTSTKRPQPDDSGLGALRTSIRRPDAGQLYADVLAARDGNADARGRVVGALAWAAFAAPAAVAAVYDLFAAAWFAQPLDAAPGEAGPIDGEETAIPEAFWTALEGVLVGPEAGYDAASITAAVAALGGALAPEFSGLAEAAARHWPDAVEVTERAVPGFIELAPLAALAPGTLGRTLHDLLTENGYDVEVLDRDAIRLSTLPPALRYLNTRILQMHDVWHLVAGYSTSASHEIAISAFQLAQFGHNYSAMFLAVVGAITHLQRPEVFPVIGLLVAEAWQHGRRTPPLMSVEWEAEWAADIEDIRARHGITPYESLLPANLFELAGTG